MRTLVGRAGDECLKFGQAMYNTDCYQYEWVPDREAPIGPLAGGCTTPDFTPTAVAWIDHELANVQCKFYLGENCDGEEAKPLPGCEDRLEGIPNTEIHSFRCVSSAPPYPVTLTGRDIGC